jgi:hypothetical protein
MNKETKKFLKDKGNTFHIELLTFFNMRDNKEELDENIVLLYSYPEGSYSLTLKDLRLRAKKEMNKLKNQLKNESEEL